MAANPNLTRKTLVLARTESTFGTQNLPREETGVSSQAMLLFDEVNPVSMDVQVVEKQVVRASLTKNQNLIGRRLFNLKPKTMLSNAKGFVNGTTGSTGAASTNGGIPPFFSPLLRACALSETTAGSASVIYRPRSSGFESATAVVYADTIKHTVVGAIGTFTLEGTGGEGIEMMFDLKGRYAAPEANSLPTVTYPLDEKVLCASENLSIAGGTTLSAPIVRSFKFDMGNTTVERKDANSTFGLYGLYITDRKPTFEVVLEVEALGTFDPFADLANATTGSPTSHTVKFLHGGGASAGQKNVGLYFGSLQLKDVQYQDDGGIRTYALSYDVFNTTDDGDFTMRFGYVGTGDLTA